MSDISQTTATCGGFISSDGGASVTARGVCWKINQTPTIDDYITSDGTGTGGYKSSISGLTPDTVVCFRAYATNSAGTGYGNLVAITTPRENTVPIVLSSSASIVTESAAVCECNITSNGGADVLMSGVCWSTGQTPTRDDNKTTDGTKTGIYTSNIKGLTPDTKYYFRAYAVNNIGTGYGDIVSFTTMDIITDIDGNIYHSVIIGNHVWMVENLKVTHYRNGNVIPKITDNEEWGPWDMATGAYCDYNNNVTNATVYGRLYNHFAVIDNRNIAPQGWHVASDEDWNRLEDYCLINIGGKLKEKGTTHWSSPNTGATNETGFTALPGGHRNSDGDFSSIRRYSYFWTSTGDNFHGYYRSMYYFDSYIERSITIKDDGCSVRCVRD